MNNVLFSNEKLDLLFVKGKKIDFIKKIRSVVCEVKKKKKGDLICKNQICFGKLKKMRFDLWKSDLLFVELNKTRYVLCLVKKWFIVYEKPDMLLETNKKDF